MNARIDHLLDEALTLNADERSALVVALLDSLDGEDEASAGRAWADEIQRRRTALSADPTRSVSWSEARARLSSL